MSEWRTLEELQPIIEFGYEILGYRELGDLGYRFLSSPKSTLCADKLIMSINPAGNKPDYENDSMFTADETSAYVDERWMAAPIGSSSLQLQYQALFKFLNWNPHSVLQAPFSPYRHPSWSEMPRDLRNRTIDFCAEKIWKPYFSENCPSGIISVGKPPAKEICRAIPSQILEQYSVETGWNNAACRTATIYKFQNDTVMVQIPHLSRFGIMTAQPCQSHLQEIFSPLIRR